MSLLFSFTGLFSFTWLLLNGDIVTVWFYRAVVLMRYRYCSILQGWEISLLFNFTGLLFQGYIETVQFYSAVCFREISLLFSFTRLLLNGDRVTLIILLQNTEM